MAAVGAVTLLFFILFYKEMFALSFDEEYAVLSGIPRRGIH
jgi:zinc transport system permease protein